MLNTLSRNVQQQQHERKLGKWTLECLMAVTAGCISYAARSRLSTVVLRVIGPSLKHNDAHTNIRPSCFPFFSFLDSKLFCTHRCPRLRHTKQLSAICLSENNNVFLCRDMCVLFCFPSTYGPFLSQTPQYPTRKLRGAYSVGSCQFVVELVHNPPSTFF